MVAARAQVFSLWAAFHLEGPFDKFVFYSEVLINSLAGTEQKRRIKNVMSRISDVGSRRALRS